MNSRTANAIRQMQAGLGLKFTGFANYHISDIDPSAISQTRSEPRGLT